MPTSNNPDSDIDYSLKERYGSVDGQDLSMDGLDLWTARYFRWKHITCSSINALLNPWN